MDRGHSLELGSRGSPLSMFSERVRTMSFLHLRIVFYSQKNRSIFHGCVSVMNAGHGRRHSVYTCSDKTVIYSELWRIT